MQDCQNLREETLIYRDFVKAFLVSIRDSDAADRNPMLVASASAAREHFETLQNELDKVWDMYQRTQREAGSGS